MNYSVAVRAAETAAWHAGVPTASHIAQVTISTFLTNLNTDTYILELVKPFTVNMVHTARDSHQGFGFSLANCLCYPWCVCCFRGNVREELEVKVIFVCFSIQFQF